ncbi:Protein F25E2.3 [Aphelenchoides avenae]|nr:Protein F25E2.3 [Aphelenchus avenae]
MKKKQEDEESPALVSRHNYSGMDAEQQFRHGFTWDFFTSLDQSIWFHDYNFRADDWLLLETWTPVANSGRGLAQGRMWTRDGRLILSSAQECLGRSRKAKSRL